MGNGMERIWNFFENMNEYVYVADADTHEMVYMNKKMRDTYWIHSKEELAGKKYMSSLHLMPFLYIPE